ncbi:hypothetical protein CHARACLAT_011057 [Characodon lateralis]|uniref:Uncharacterized protein n=1 Tax=Characodon lateralis TaxID=208331 RepID=A0ABU7DZK1_9TELE|nr:hypothetical protein [Characodon lateralis]
MLFYNTNSSILFFHCTGLYNTSSLIWTCLLLYIDSIVFTLTGKASLIALSHPFTINAGPGFKRTASGKKERDRAEEKEHIEN